MRKIFIFYKYRRRLITYLLYCIFLLVIIITVHCLLYTTENIHCYRIKTEDTLPNIANYNPKKGKSIFFHETSCKSFTKGKIWIKSRQACAVESAARLNPTSEVYLLYTSPMNFKFEGDESDRFLQVLLSYPNVRILHLNYENYTKGSPVENLYSSGKIENSLHVVAHASDVLRYLTLWKYGGIYMDLDVIVLRPLTDLNINYAGIESTSVVASGVLNFDATGNGHKYVEDCLFDLKSSFDGKKWSTNGPGVITRLLHTLCGSNTTDDMLDNECGGFTAYPANVFYPVPWQNWRMYFEQEFLDAVINMTQNSFTIHMWNKLSEEIKIPVTSKNIPYLYFAKKYCPKIVNECDEVF
ncbi:lactosylceramide 4-alpha-galactosyltransferase-like [Diorhabda sublineata]|uniref:lactosylceramide 4-alpha-galactosyltransferase-like n=1 Tax=Diorhabda sublineata TaxID=1163346 RepID=UPI0024E09972|nr:lactosylceramide 4-alpha-galactosyltransferase-like [Diorhabda sublineata]XP_056639599.1 lactosylceramide 4-alpha-galactosyltransferase-like [Diorhabda sublineata]XP_056639608.1 lactosylceramide 4-alpha-galactosyltransferase-like [Diorhabda sublineata]